MIGICLDKKVSKKKVSKVDDGIFIVKALFFGYIICICFVFTVSVSLLSISFRCWLDICYLTITYKHGIKNEM